MTKLINWKTYFNLFINFFSTNLPRFGAIVTKKTEIKCYDEIDKEKSKH